MTLRELRKIISQSILPQLSNDFQSSDTLIYLRKESEILRGFFFENSKAVTNGVYVYCFVMPLMLKSEDIYFNYGSRIKTPNGTDIWLFDKENKEKTVSLLIQAITAQELLSDIVDSKTFINQFFDKVSNVRNMEAITYCCCFADIENYKIYLQKLIEYIDEHGNLSWGWVNNIKSKVQFDLNKQQADFENELNEIVRENWSKINSGWYN